MLNKHMICIYSLIFLFTTSFKLVPFKWNSNTLQMTKCSNNNYRIWIFVLIIQFTHLLFLLLRFVESVIVGVSPSVLIFQFVWNILFVCPIISHITTIRNKDQLPYLVSHWLQIEMAWNTYPDNAIQIFLVLFLPIAILQTTASALMYIENPIQPQYLYSIWALYYGNGNKYICYIFGVIELCLVSLNWLLLFFYVFFLLGAAGSINSWIKAARLNIDSTKAFEIYLLTRKYTEALNVSIRFLILSTKIVVFSSQVTCIYNTFRSELPILPLLLMPLSALAGMLAFIYFFPPMCAIRKNSETCITIWKHKSTKSRLALMLWKSQPPIGLNSGEFYILTNKTMLTFFYLITNYVITTLLAF